MEMIYAAIRRDYKQHLVTFAKYLILIRQVLNFSSFRHISDKQLL